MNQILQVARIQLVNARMVIGLPLFILLCVLAANVVIFLAIPWPESDDGSRSTGALMSIYIATLVVHVQTMSQMFPFALGMSVTRRDFVAAAGTVVVGQSLLYGIVLWAMQLLERATDGWGLRIGLFDLPFLETGNPLAQILVYAGPFLFVSFAGLWTGIVYQRWGQLGVWGLVLGLGALAVGFVALVGMQDWWSPVGSFFSDTPAVAMFAGYPVLIAVLLAGATYVTSRKAVP